MRSPLLSPQLRFWHIAQTQSKIEIFESRLRTNPDWVKAKTDYDQARWQSQTSAAAHASSSASST